MSHPSAIDLEAFACGDDVVAVRDHLAVCAACAAHVESLRERAVKRPRLALERVLSEAPRERAATIAPVRKLPRWSAAVAPALAAAAALALFLRAKPENVAPPQEAAPMRSVATATEPETRFKGGIQAAVVRERDGKQDRFTSAVSVKPGDRLRVEVALDRAQAILAAVLGDDGSWLELMQEGVRDGGTYFSERAARIDEQPLGGVILVGDPEVVRRARATRDMTGLVQLRVTWEPR